MYGTASESRTQRTEKEYAALLIRSSQKLNIVSEVVSKNPDPIRKRLLANSAQSHGKLLLLV
jgi:hypothetical protein